MFKIFLWCLFIYFAYRFIFDLVIPVSRTATHLKRKVAEMQQQRGFQQQNSQSSAADFAHTPRSSTSASTQHKKDDYIEFEEVK